MRTSARKKENFVLQPADEAGGGAVAAMAGKKIRPKLRAHTADGTEKVDRRRGI